MKAAALILLFVFCAIECRKVVPINKHANIDFINMESGGMRPAQPAMPAQKQPVPAPAAPKQPVPAPAAPKQPAPAQATPVPSKPPTPVPAAKPAAPLPTPPPKSAQPVTSPAQIKPVPVNPAPAANPITTPGPGSVKSLINFYDSRGNASPIRPYSYSQAVKQG